MNVKSLFRIAIGAIVPIAFAARAAAQSQIYNPMLESPVPSADHGLEIVACGAMLPEARPASVGQYASPSADVTARYLLADHLQVGLKGFLDLSGSGYTGGRRGGVGGELTWLLSDRGHRAAIAVVVRGQALVDEIGLEGGGAGISFVVAPGGRSIFQPYLGLGPVVGVRRFTVSHPPRALFLEGDNGEPEWGYGAAVNLGGTLRIGEEVALFAEVVYGVQQNQWERLTELYLLPGVGVHISI